MKEDRKNKEKFPEEFLDNLELDAVFALRQWLKTNKIPEDVISFIEGIQYFLNLRKMEPDSFMGGPERYEFELFETVSRLTWGIVELGGVFVSMEGCTSLPQVE